MTVIGQPTRSASYALIDYVVKDIADISVTLDQCPMLDAGALWTDIQVGGEKLIKWAEKDTHFQTMHLSANVAATTTSVTFNVATNYARIGDILRCDAAAGTEYVLVTAVAGNALTVTRAYNGSTKRLISTTRNIYITGNVQAEGATYTAGISTIETEVTNYLQISTEQYMISRSLAKATPEYGNNTPLDRERLSAAGRLRVKTARAMIHNATSVKMTSSTRGLTKGIAGFLSTNKNAITSSTIGGTTTNTTLTAAKLNRFLNRCKISGQSDFVSIFAGGTAYSALCAALKADGTVFIPVGYMGVGGAAITQFFASSGQMVRFVLDRNVPSDTLYAMDIGNAAAQWGVAFAREYEDVPELGGTRDAVGGNINNEFGVVVMNEKCHGSISGIVSGG